MDEQSKKDLDDAYECIINNFATPSVMLLYKIGESKVREFYKKEMKKESSEVATMGSMAKELREKQQKEIELKTRTKGDSLVHYIISQTEERNLAQHPTKRYGQIEAEQIFIFVKKLIEDINARL